MGLSESLNCSLKGSDGRRFIVARRGVARAAPSEARGGA
uniref:Uncharacterized protein n=1 Tax=Arundo donax TaxID=35708 RepID=A0A0A9GLU1_ARUDO